MEKIKELREKTGAGRVDCKKALDEAGGDMDKAVEILRKKGGAKAAKKADRATNEGLIDIIDSGDNKKVSIAKILCETDFVAQNEDFAAFSRDVAMQIAAANPTYIKKEDIPEDVLAGQKDQDADVKESCLLEQPFIKDSKKNIQTCMNELVAKIGENMFIGRFVRYKVNEIA